MQATRIRVVTAIGLGEIDPGEHPGTLPTVHLNAPCTLEQPARVMAESEVFPFSDFALVRVVNATGVGVISNLQFLASYAELEQAFVSPRPPDETRFALDLERGSFSQTPLGFAVERYLWLQPWLDRWSKEMSGHQYLEREEDPTPQEFDQWQAQCGGTGGGIFCPAFLDIDDRQILRFAIAVTAPRGVVFCRRFPR